MDQTYRDSKQYQRFAAAIQQRLSRARLAQAEEIGAHLLKNGLVQLKSFNRTLTISPETLEVKGAFDLWHDLIALQYIADSDGCAPSNQWMGLTEFKDGGVVRGSSFDAEIRAKAGNYFTNRSIRDIDAACRLTGGSPYPHQGNAAYRFDLMPLIPVLAIFWLADDEFPASAKVLFDSNVGHHLGVEAAGTAALLLMDMLENAVCA